MPGCVFSILAPLKAVAVVSGSPLSSHCSLKFPLRPTLAPTLIKTSQKWHQRVYTISAKIISDRNIYSGQLFGDRQCITVPENLFPGIIWTIESVMENLAGKVFFVCARDKISGIIPVKTRSSEFNRQKIIAVTGKIAGNYLAAIRNAKPYRINCFQNWIGNNFCTDGNTPMSGCIVPRTRTPTARSAFVFFDCVVSFDLPCSVLSPRVFLLELLLHWLCLGPRGLVSQW